MHKFNKLTLKELWKWTWPKVVFFTFESWFDEYVLKCYEFDITWITFGLQVLMRFKSFFFYIILIGLFVIVKIKVCKTLYINNFDLLYIQLYYSSKVYQAKMSLNPYKLYISFEVLLRRTKNLYRYI